MQKPGKRFLAAVVTPLIVVALVFGTSLYFLPASALGRTLAAEETIQTADGSVPGDTTTEEFTEPTPSTEPTADEAATPEPTTATETPTDAATTPVGTTTPEPGATPEPSVTPESTPTPSHQPGITFSETKDDMFVSIETEMLSPETSEASLHFTLVSASSDAETFARYRALLEQKLTADQLDHCVIYELRYSVDGKEATPPQSAAEIKIGLNAATRDLLASSSISAWNLSGDGAPDSLQISSASARVKEDTVSFSSDVCPCAIVLSRGALPDGAVTPTPEPSAQTLYEYESDGLYVSGSPASPDVLPEGVALSAERITSENNPERYAALSAMLQQLYGTENTIAFFAYDISFHAAGQEIEPVGDVVNVTIRDSAFAKTVEEPLVYHVIDEQGADPALKEIPAEAVGSEGEEQVVFAADSFSVFIVLANGTTLTLADGSGLTYKVIATEADTFTHTSYYSSSKGLGLAGNFHIVAFNNASLGAHTNGNVLAKSASANSNFGTNGLTNELSYIQTYTQVNGVSASSTAHTLVVGTANTITAMDNGNAFGVNGTKLDKPKNLWQDKATTTLPFIDLVALKSSVKSMASSLAGNSNAYITSHLSTSAGSSAESYIELNNVDKVGFYNITASALSSYTYFGVQGFQSGHSGTVIINVDCSGYSGTLTLPECRMFYGSGGTATSVNLVEVTSFVNGRILWNLVNCTANVTTRLLYASLLAPDASVTLGQNMNGTVIANNVTVGAESHRDDFIGETSNGVTVTGTKVWTDYATGSPANTSVTFQLYRSTDGGVTKTAYGTPVTLNSTAGWSYNWTELPFSSLYTIVETTVLKGSTDVTTSYSVTYSTQTGVSSGTITVSNQYLYTLPETGGTGVMAFYLAGGGLLLLAAIMIVRKKRTTA